jgi:hypothetical protein
VAFRADFTKQTKDGRKKFKCILCGGKETYRWRQHAKGSHHQENVRICKEQMARLNERVEMEPVKSVQSFESDQRVYEINEESEEEDQTAHNLQNVLDWMDSPRIFDNIEPNRTNPDDIEINDLIDDKLEEELRREEARLLEEENPGVFERSNQFENTISNEADSRWYPYKNKMVRCQLLHVQSVE